MLSSTAVAPESFSLFVLSLLKKGKGGGRYFSLFQGACSATPLASLQQRCAPSASCSEVPRSRLIAPLRC